MFAEADFLSVAECIAFCRFWQAHLVSENEHRVIVEVYFAHVFASFFKNVDLGLVCLRLQQGFEACFVVGYAGVRLALEHVLEDLRPGVLVGAHVKKRRPVYPYAYWRRGRTRKHRVENYVPPQSVRQKERGNYALMHHVQPSSIV